MASADSDSEESRNLNSIFLSCPHIGDKIFGFLEDDDLKYLKVCREVCKGWKVYVDVGTRFWSRIQAKSTHFGLTKLHLAASRGNIEVVGLILNSVDNNETSLNPLTKYGETPLHLASCNGHLEVVKMILDAIKEDGDLNPKDKFGNTPLHEAAREGHYEVYRLIMDLVVEKTPARRDYGSTPLHMAAANGHLEICQLILQNVNTLDCGGECSPRSLLRGEDTGTFANCSIPDQSGAELR